MGAPFAAVVNSQPNKRANRMRSTILLFAFSKAQCGALKLPCPTHRDLDTSQGVVIGTILHMNNREGMLRFMIYGSIEATFAYQDVQWVDANFEDDGSWTVDVNNMEAIMDLLHKKRIGPSVCSIKPYADSLVGEPVATSKEGQRACTVCHMDVQVKKIFQQMAYHIGRGDIPIAAAPPCGFCGNTHGRCHLVMNKVKTTEAHFPPTAPSCAHGCLVKHNVASLCNPIVHNEPI